MLNEMSILGIIPARGGSKRIPKKCIRPLLGRPLIAYAVEAGRRSKYLDKLIVSTDSQEIADTAEKYGAHIPFIRPADLATDHAKTHDVIHHAVDFFEQNDPFQIVVIVQPTSPLVLAVDIDLAIETLLNTKSDSCVSVCEAYDRPEWMYRLEKNKAVPHLSGVEDHTRSQDLPPVYRLNGAVYAMRKELILDQGRIISHKNGTAIIMPKERSVDIDEPLDFEIAELLMRKLRHD